MSDNGAAQYRRCDELVVVVAARDEADRVAETLSALGRAFPGAALLVADDGSRDETAAIARRAGAVVVSGARRVGKGRAMTVAVCAALGALVEAKDGEKGKKKDGMLVEREKGDRAGVEAKDDKRIDKECREQTEQSDESGDPEVGESGLGRMKEVFKKVGFARARARARSTTDLDVAFSGAIDPPAGAIGPTAGAIDPVAEAIGPTAGAVDPVAEAIGPTAGAVDPVAEPVVLLCDGDLGSSARELAHLVDAIRRGEADIAIASFSTRAGGGLGLALAFARWAVRRRCGLSLRAPLSGQRALRADVLADVLPFASGYGMEVAMTIDAVRAGRRIVEIELPLSHRPTGRGLAGFAHRGRQLADFVRVYVARRSNDRHLSENNL